jgi:inner membrane protein
VVETQNFLASMLVDSLAPDVDPGGQMQIRYKPEETPATLAAKKSYLGRVFLDWAAYPLVETEHLDAPVGGYIVRFQDLRFASPGRNGPAPLSCAVELDKNLNVVSESVGSRSRAR